jgi:ribonuclease P protein component
MAALEMIRSAVTFRAIQTDSRSRAHPLLLLRYRRNDLDRTRFGISTGRRVGSAVVRNSVRRRLRTALRRLLPMIEQGWDVLIVARPQAASAAQVEFEFALERLFRTAGMLRPETGEGGAPRP